MAGHLSNEISIHNDGQCVSINGWPLVTCLLQLHHHGNQWPNWLNLVVESFMWYLGIKEYGGVLVFQAFAVWHWCLVSSPPCVWTTGASSRCPHVGPFMCMAFCVHVFVLWLYLWLVLTGVSTWHKCTFIYEFQKRNLPVHPFFFKSEEYACFCWIMNINIEDLELHTHLWLLWNNRIWTSLSFTQ